MDWISSLCDRIAGKALWRESLREMARHLPPSAAELRLLIVGCGSGNSARELREVRPDLRIIGLDTSIKTLRVARRAVTAGQSSSSFVQANTARLPLSDSSVDAVMGLSIYYLLAERPAFLLEAYRVLRPGGRLILLDPAAQVTVLAMIPRLLQQPRVTLSAVGWRMRSRTHILFTLEQMLSSLTEAGFVRVLAERAARGYGILGRGEKPYAQGTATAERIAQVAGESEPGQRLAAADLPAAIRGKFLFLLVEQFPNKPAWALKPEDVIRWEAAMIGEHINPSNRRLLVFTSLPKAVAFMQPAVMSGLLVGINKVAKFDKARALEWRTEVLLNPDFEMLRAADYDFGAARLEIDLKSAVTGEE